MKLGIRLTNDFVFKKVVGSAGQGLALVGLLNAILQLSQPIVLVEVLNPFSYQEFQGGKLIVLDLLVRDQRGWSFQVEMQVSPGPYLTQRLFYYASSLVKEQLIAGDNYGKLRPVYSICLLEKGCLWPSAAAHHRFRLWEVEQQLPMHDLQEIHTVELSKYNISETDLATASPLEQWVFLFRTADRYDVASLRALLPDQEFQQAIDSLDLIASKSEDLLMVDQREKALRDEMWKLSNARMEGLAQGREEGLAEGREEGLAEGREVGLLIGRLQLLQEILGEPVGQVAELARWYRDAIEREIAALQQRRGR